MYDNVTITINVVYIHNETNVVNAHAQFLYIRVALNQFHSHIEQECHEVGEYCLEEGVKSELFNSLKKLNKY